MTVLHVLSFRLTSVTILTHNQYYSKSLYNRCICYKSYQNADFNEVLLLFSLTLPHIFHIVSQQVDTR